MRVTHIITRLVIGGAQENTVATVFGLREKQGVEPHLVSGPTIGPEGSMESAFASCPGMLTIVPQLVRPIHPPKDYRALAKLESFLRGQNPQIVHTHSGKAGVLGRLAARRAGIPVIIHHIHGPSFGPFQGPLANWLFTAAERYAARATTHFVCSADAMTRRYLAAGIGRPEMFTRVFSGFRVDLFADASNDPSFRRFLGLDSRHFVIGVIARLAPLKGHGDVLAAFGSLLTDCPEARLLLIGDGPLRDQITALAHQAGLAEKVIFAGLLPPMEVPRYVGIMDCLAHLSSREGLPRALPQALAAGKPVVSYDCDGADEVCLQGETGFLVKAGNVPAAAKALLDLARNADLRNRFGENGRQFVQKHFRVEKMVDDQYQLYLKLLQQHAPRSGT
jgi:glycosyltransferase involved in cell wall biosynthesis